MLKKVKNGRTFGDVLLIPNYSNVIPRDVCVKTRLTKKINLNIPIISAAMDTVSEDKMGIAMALNGGIAFIHKNLTIEQQAKMVVNVKKHKFSIKQYPDACIDSKGKLIAGAAISIANNCLERVKALVKAGVDVVSLDSAHGDSYNVISKVKMIKKQFPNLQLIAGNIATKSGAKHLIRAGVDGLKLVLVLVLFVLQELFLVLVYRN